MGTCRRTALGTRHFAVATAISICVAAMLPWNVGAATPSPTPKKTLPPAPPSAIGSEMVQWLAVSPAYKQTGLVVAQSAQLNCPQGTQCIHLWVTHDGGSTWQKAAAKGWNGGRVAIAVDAKGHETLFAGVSAQLARSEDDGESWTQAGPGGVPTVLPTYATDGGVAVASTSQGSDYLLHGNTPLDVSGSGGADTDLLYMAAPTYPKAGSFSPSLLTALDKKTSALLVLHCTAQFSCGTPAVIPGPASGSAMTGAGTVLLPSGAYADDGTVFADTPLGLAKSTDGGATFTPLNIVPTTGASATTTPMMALAPGYAEHGGRRTAYVAIFQLFESGTKGHSSGGIYETTDGGATWNPVASTGPFAGGAQAVAAAPDGRLFAGYYDGYGHGGLLCSTDQGHTWIPACPAIKKQGPGSSANGAGNAACQAAQAGCNAGADSGGAGAGANGAAGSASDDNGANKGAVSAAGTKLSSDANKTRTALVVALIIAGIVGILAALRVVLVRRARRSSPES
jgi:hypothetical protein